jgi:hypothetical protein
VVGDRHEIERALELHVALCIALLVVGLDADAFAPGEPVGVARRVSRVLGAGVERVGRVHVGIAEERPAQRVVGAARLALLGHRVRTIPGARRHGHPRDRNDREQGSHLHGHLPSRVPRSAETSRRLGSPAREHHTHTGGPGKARLV